MNQNVGLARIGQWYLRSDKGQVFQVTGLDAKARTIEIQSFDGDLDEIDEESWSALPLELAEPPEDWTGPVDDVEVDDLGYTETDMTRKDWAEPLEAIHDTAAGEEAWQDATPANESDSTADESRPEEITSDQPIPSHPLG